MLFPSPRPIRHKKAGSQIEYCEYHKLYGHSTNECYNIKNVIKKLAREGRPERLPHTPERHIHMINGGFAGGGISKSSRKRQFKEVYQVGEDNKASDLPTISFTKEDAQGIIPGHNDPVVITIILANANLHRTLVDQDSSADILFKPTFDKLGLEEKDLRAYPDSLFGLGDTPI
ncbi:uncharacterized protein [Arachis hypogaea]|uniref:uncharacterized protein n=1 Tax=Arachis hypogaea TaxID=3818 RepID=UPI003B21244B